MHRSNPSNNNYPRGAPPPLPHPYQRSTLWPIDPRQVVGFEADEVHVFAAPTQTGGLSVGYLTVE